MITTLFLLLVLVILLGMAYLSVNAVTSALVLFSLIALSAVLPVSSIVAWLLVPAAFISVLFAIPSLRKQFITQPAFKLIKKQLPPISETEREAIDAGTVWWDGELFSGKPNWNTLLDTGIPSISEHEQDFLDGPVNELCRMSNAWEIEQNSGLVPQRIIDFICDKGFLGMIIPKSYGGMGLSAVAQSEVLIRLSNAGGSVANLVAVPNSLGPGELLIKYGTEEQKDYYLPRLAKGIDIPCFALTGPTAGSDATSIPDTGIVCKGTWEGKEVLGMNLTFNKRYITLAPIATLIGLAFRLQDPDGLLGDTKDYGITCALIPRDTQGMNIGRRHKPTGDTFINGPIEGENVFVPLDFIIGGTKMAGKGWRMLVNCLSVGRAVTLPSIGTSASKRALMGTSAYANVRQQFGLPIGKFEGVQKPLARITGFSYISDAARKQTIQSVDHGQKPSVPSAILKYHCTEMARQSAIDAMDIHGGKAIMEGPKNYIAQLYQSIPVGITVEGANIMTRNLMIFGQGAIRSHPYILKTMELAQAPENEENMRQFDQNLMAHIGFTLRNVSRCLFLGSGFFKDPTTTQHEHLKPYYAHINRLSSVFALTSDVAMLTLGAKLKFREALSARLGDLLSMLYLASMVIKQHEDHQGSKKEWPVVQWSLLYLLHQYQMAFDDLMANLPNKGIAFTLKTLGFGIGRRFTVPKDKLERKVVAAISDDTALRQYLIAGIYDESVPHNPLAEVNAVFMESLNITPIQKKIKHAIKAGKIKKQSNQAILDDALAQHIITPQEAEQIATYEQHLTRIIQVDDFPQEDNPA